MKEKNSKKGKSIIAAFLKGYRCTEKGDILSPKGNTLKGQIKDFDGVRYRLFSVRIDGYVCHILVHRFVAYQKFGDIMFNCDCVRHLNGNSLDNSFDNIELGTTRDNILDIPKEKRVAMAKYAVSCCKGYNDDEMVKEIKAFYSKTKSYKQTMNMFGISSKGTLHFILNNR